jgi:archaellum component FlaC
MPTIDIDIHVDGAEDIDALEARLRRIEERVDRIRTTMDDIRQQAGKLYEGVDDLTGRLQALPNHLEEQLSQLEGLFQ